MSNTNEVWAPLRNTAVLTTVNSVTITVPEDRVWGIDVIFVTYTSNATGAARQIVVELATGSTILSNPKAGATQAISITRTYSFALSNPQQTAFDASSVPNIKQTLDGPVLLKEFDTITVKDENNESSASGENVTVVVSGIEMLLSPHLGIVLSGDLQTITS